MDETLSPPDPACTAALLFNTIWDTMVDILGTVVTATLVRRSAKRAATRAEELALLTVDREGFEYACKLPSSWQDASPETVAAVRELAHELRPLLIELTGLVLIRRLSAIPLLRRCEIFSEEQAS